MTVLEYIRRNRAEFFTSVFVLIIMISAGIGIGSGIGYAIEGTRKEISLKNTHDFPVRAETSEIPETYEEPKIPDIPEIPETIEIPKPKPKPPEKYIIKNVGHTTQYDDLITGCEIVSTKIVLSYYGKKVSYDDMLKHLKKSNLKLTRRGRLYGQSPDDAFIGDPKQLSGFGCFPMVICDMINNRYKFDDIYAENTTGCQLDELIEDYIINDTPVLIWVTDSMVDVGEGDSWYLTDERGNITKEKFTWPLNEHCVVLMGYDKNNYYVSDPLSWNEYSKYDKKIIEKRYKELKYRSVAIVKKL